MRLTNNIKIKREGKNAKKKNPPKQTRTLMSTTIEQRIHFNKGQRSFRIIKMTKVLPNVKQFKRKTNGLTYTNKNNKIKMAEIS